MGITQASSQMTVSSEAPRAPARGICGEAKRNSAEATRLRPYGLRRGRLSPFHSVLPHGASWRRRVKDLETHLFKH